MITIDQIISSNLSMLKDQEASLQKSLDFIRKAIQLFSTQSGSAHKGRKRGRKKGYKAAPKAASAAPAKKAVKKTTRARQGGKHIDRIIGLLKEKGAPVTSNELIHTLFSRQSVVKDFKRYSTLIYPVLTKAYKSAILKLKDKMIHLG